MFLILILFNQTNGDIINWVCKKGVIFYNVQNEAKFCQGITTKNIVKTYNYATGLFKNLFQSIDRARKDT